MAVLFFSLRGVPEDEAEDVRALLAANAIEFYETPGGNWGLSMPAIWLYHQEDLIIIQPLFDEYQQQRAITQRNLYLQMKNARKNHAWLPISLSRVMQLFVLSLFMGFILYISVKWVFELGL